MFFHIPHATDIEHFIQSCYSSPKNEIPTFSRHIHPRFTVRKTCTSQYQNGKNHSAVFKQVSEVTLFIFEISL